MKYLSLFSGIGGFELGIQQAYEDLQELCIKNKRQSKRASSGNKEGQCEQLHKFSDEGLSCIGYSEIDKYAIQVYNKHFNHKNYGDITKISAETLPDFDLIVGGFPCQSFSIAGKRGGFDDTRGTLFFDIARILKAKKPRLLLLENVKGLLSHDSGQTFKTIISTLTELGYDCQWQVLNSKNFGVPQNRERMFIVGHLRETSRPEVFPIGESDNKPINKTDKQGCSNTLTGRSAGGQNRRGNYINVVGNLNSPTWQKRNESTRRVYGTDGIAPTIPTAQGGGVMAKILEDARIRRLTPKECERLQGFPDDWTKEGMIEDGSNLISISDTQRYKMCGNAVTVNVIKEIIKKLI